jgi:branched-chain amino acid transport system permease protein
MKGIIDGSSEDATENGRSQAVAERVGTQLKKFEGPNTFGKGSRYWAVFAGIMVLATIYPFIAGQYSVLTMTGFLIWTFLALSLSVIWGYTGIFSFGQNAFFGLGGYTFGVVAINLIDSGLSTPAALAVACLVPAVLAALLGYFMFYGRVRGVFVAIITLAVPLILELILGRTAGEQYTIGEAQLGGRNGMAGIPDLSLGNAEIGYVGTYYVVLLSLIMTYLGLRYVLNSSYGYAMVATRENEERTEMFGYDTRRIKLVVFTAAAALGGFGGALYASWGNFISPPVMGLATAALPVIWVTVGGRHYLVGAILGALVLQHITNFMGSQGESYALVVVGLILIGAILFFPNGVMKFVDNYLGRDQS